MTPTNRCARALADMDADTQSADRWRQLYTSEAYRRGQAQDALRHARAEVERLRESRYRWHAVAFGLTVLPLLAFYDVAPWRSIVVTAAALALVLVGWTLGERAMERSNDGK